MRAILTTILLSILMVVSCEKSLDNECVEELAGIQEVIAPDTVNVNESLNLEIVYWMSCQSFERLDESTTDSTINIDIVVCNSIANNPDVNCNDQVHIDTVTKQINFTKKGKFKIFVNDSNKIIEIEVI